MSIEQIIEKSHQMGLSSQLLDLIGAAFEAGKTAGVNDAAITLGFFDEDEAIEILKENFPGVEG